MDIIKKSCQSTYKTFGVDIFLECIMAGKGGFMILKKQLINGNSSRDGKEPWNESHELTNKSFANEYVHRTNMFINRGTSCASHFSTPS